MEDYNANKYRWESRVRIYKSRDLENLEDILNDSFKDTFIVGTQPFFVEKEKEWVVFVYFKIKV